MYEVILTGAQAKAARARLGLSQGKVAVSVGLNRTYLSLFENGKYLLPDGDLLRLRDFYSDLDSEFDDPGAVHSDDLGEAGSCADSDGDSAYIRVKDGFVIPQHMDDDEVERILSEYAENKATIHRLCAYDLRGHHTDTFLWDELDQDEVEKRTNEVLVLMAKNHVLVEALQGGAPVSACEGKPQTTGDFVEAMLGG